MKLLELGMEENLTGELLEQVKRHVDETPPTASPLDNAGWQILVAVKI